MFQKIQKRKFIHIQVKYHTCKNQGLELGRDARNHHTETQVLGFRNRLPLPISLGSMGDCKVFCRSSGEGGGEIMVRNSGVLISGKNLGETEFFACSCSNAAAQMRGTVLAGNNISNITGGRKTTGIK